MKNVKHSKGIKLAAALFLLLSFLVIPMSIALGNSAEYALNNHLTNNTVFISTDHSATVVADNDAALVLRVEIISGKKLLRVSFNANEGSEGKLKLIDNRGKEVLLANFELIKFPYYATVDITNLPTGTYTANLITQLAVHSSELNID